MKRRNALKTLTLFTGGGVILPATLFNACQSDTYQPIFFTKKVIHLLNEIAETILPTTTDSKGAGSLNVANFIDVYVAECVSVEQQKLLEKGVAIFEENNQQELGKPFLKMTPMEKHNYLVDLDAIAKKSTNLHYFSILKSLVLFAYFTSKEGAENALRYVPIPGKYDGDYPFEKGDKAWALG